MYEEDKQLICTLLLPVLRRTRNLHDLEELEYKRKGDDEIVIATFNNGYQKHVNVSLDSGTAMIVDVINHIV
ncbi:hypothetical protein EDX97_07800 [Absicoccus porci]|uniref:Uncharacterized protein n=1 Tax=Absicoccus porci TaxID=2486576 RepID=A0A3N0I102_9FIRM|nr:hypothetical protein [Absicoccus porci]RNM30674.1 hypothetical protein EDX97_07800 [Absicoccus porci]